MASPETPLKGADRIAAYLKTLPDAPGVYRMLNAAGDVLYVGKAKSLKKRVASYARGGVHADRLTRMVAETAEMLFVTTASERSVAAARIGAELAMRGILSRSTHSLTQMAAHPRTVISSYTIVATLDSGTAASLRPLRKLV